MSDYVVFLVDVYEGENLIFRKGIKYEILDETKDDYFIQRVKNTNEVSQFHKDLEGKMFRLIQ